MNDKVVDKPNASQDILTHIGKEMCSLLDTVSDLAQQLNNSDDLPKDLKNTTAEIVNTSHNASKLAQNVADFSALCDGRLMLDTNEFNLKDLFEELDLVVGMHTKGKSIRYIASTVPPDCEFLQGDATRLGQVLLSLLSNSVTFTRAGQIKLTVENVTSVDDNKRHLKFSVSDTGTQINPDQLDSLFELFADIQDFIPRRIGSHGLELAICKQLVDLMGGEIRVFNAEIQGVHFEFDVYLSDGES